MIDKPTLSQALAATEHLIWIRQEWQKAEPTDMRSHRLVERQAARMTEMLLPDKCGNCGGSGKVECEKRSADEHGCMGGMLPCPSCHGSGETWNEELVEAVEAVFPPGFTQRYRTPRAIRFRDLPGHCRNAQRGTGMSGTFKLSVWCQCGATMTGSGRGDLNVVTELQTMFWSVHSGESHGPATSKEAAAARRRYERKTLRELAE